jgi:hypothetical protein
MVNLAEVQVTRGHNGDNNVRVTERDPSPLRNEHVL